MWKPKYFHEMITNIVNITIVVSPNQSWTRPSSPTLREARIDERPGLEEQREDDAGDGLREDVRQEEDQAEHRPAGESAVEHDRQGE